MTDPLYAEALDTFGQLLAQARALVHGERDALIAPSHSEALKALAPQATLLRVPGAGHNDLQEFDVYMGAFARALQAL